MSSSPDLVKEHQDFVRLIVQSILRFKVRFLFVSISRLKRIIIPQEKMLPIVEEIVGPVIQNRICPLVSALAQKSQAAQPEGNCS